ncbi:MAG: Carbonic anhydrase, gamma class, partial [uncultured Solirubrobacteraceae bacterium]
ADLCAGRLGTDDRPDRLRAPRRGGDRRRRAGRRGERLAGSGPPRRLRQHPDRPADLDPGRHGRSRHRPGTRRDRCRVRGRAQRPPGGLHRRGRLPHRIHVGGPAAGDRPVGRAGRSPRAGRQRRRGPFPRDGPRCAGPHARGRRRRGRLRPHRLALRRQRPTLRDRAAPHRL